LLESGAIIESEEVLAPAGDPVSAEVIQSIGQLTLTGGKGPLLRVQDGRVDVADSLKCLPPRAVIAPPTAPEFDRAAYGLGPPFE